MFTVYDDPCYINPHVVPVWFCFTHEQQGLKFLCGSIPTDSVYEYMNRLEQCYPSAKDRCMQYHCHFVLHSHPFIRNGEVFVKKSLSIVNKNPIYMKCFCGSLCPEKCAEKDKGACPGGSSAMAFECWTRSKQCFDNIKQGKCPDPFVRECIGKQFFTKKYKNNEEQR